jgi:hypothetical protein
MTARGKQLKVIMAQSAARLECNEICSAEICGISGKLFYTNHSKLFVNNLQQA